MKAIPRALAVAGLGLAGLVTAGCGTTHMTDTPRSATEQLLVSQAIDNSVSRLDFSPMKDHAVFFEEKCLDGSVDKGYLTSSLRQALLASGCQLVEEKAKAVYVVEARAGCVGTDKRSFLLGVPQMQLPSVLPGTPPMIPEMPLVKSSNQRGVAKVAVFAYNRQTGRAVWQSGTQEAISTSKDAYVMGVGPFHHGSVNKEDGALKELDVMGLTDGDAKSAGAAGGGPHVTQTMAWQEPAKSGIVTVGGTSDAAQAGGQSPKR